MREASLALILNQVGDLLATSHESAGWSLPGGKAEEGEVDPKRVLRREIAEELGVDVHAEHLSLLVSARGDERFVRIYHVSAIPHHFRACERQQLAFMSLPEFLARTSYSSFYSRVFPDGILHFRPTRFDDVYGFERSDLVR